MSSPLPPTLPVDFDGLSKVENLAQPLAGMVGFALGEMGLAWGFVLVFMEYHGGGTAYVASCERAEMIEVVRRQAERLAETPVPDGVRTVTVTDAPQEAAHEAITPAQAQTVAEYVPALQEAIQDELPAGWGFCLLLYAPEPGRSIVYVSTCQRETAAASLAESAHRWERHEDRPPGRLGKDS